VLGLIKSCAEKDSDTDYRWIVWYSLVAAGG
jgi:hypothetical protein